MVATTRLRSIVAVWLLALPAMAAAHDIPNDITIQAFVRPEGQTLRVVLRVPLRAMRDIYYPRRGPQAYLDVPKADGVLREAASLWIADNLDVYEDDAKLPYPAVAAVHASLPGDASFATYADAVAHVTGRRAADNVDFVWSEGLLDLILEYPIRSDRARFSIHPRLARLASHTVTAVRFLPPGGAVRAFELVGDPGLVRLDPRWHQAALRFVELGFFHILDGTDHLLFLFCLVIPFRRFRQLVAVVTSFTVAHSITLIASAYDLAPEALWFPPLVETLIATSIVYMALENIVTVDMRRRWLITFGFGLVHGFGFSFGLRQTLQFAGSHMLTSLLSFNVGVELGQIVVLGAMVPSLALVFRYGVQERMGTIVLSALVAHTGWHWMIDRWERFRQYPITWPTVDALFLLSVVRWAIVIVGFSALAWLTLGVLRKVTSGRVTTINAEAAETAEASKV